MINEMDALHMNATWVLKTLHPRKTIVGCRWIYTVKVGVDGEVDRLKASIVAKGYTQILGLDYGNTFSPIAKMTSIQ